MMKNMLLKFVSFLLLLSLTACRNNNQIMRFSDWNLKAPDSELLHSYSDQDRGFQGDGIDCYIFDLTPEYKEYITSYLEDQKIELAHQDSTLELSSDISHEIFQVDNTEISDYFISMKNMHSALIPQENDRLIIIVDESKEKISFVFSLY